MMQMIKISFIFSIIISVLSCTQNKNYPSDTLRISLPSEPPSLDWNLATDNVSYQILNQIMEGLTQFDEDMNPIPALAKSWEMSPDGKVYTFFLDQNYFWSDGKRVSAQDFYDSWERLLNPKTAAEYAYLLFDIVGAQEYNQGQFKDPKRLGLKVIDPFTFQVTLKRPIVFFPAITTFMVTFPIRKDLIEKYGSKWTEAQNMVTCGPYQLSQWHHEYKIQLSRNPYYQGTPKPSIDHIMIYFVAEESSSYALYQRGYLDSVTPPDIALKLLENHPHFVRKAKLRGYYYAFNQKKAPFDNPNMRKAFAHALNKATLNQILKGGERPSNSWIPPGMFAFDPDLGLEFSPQKGRSYLQEYRKEIPGPLPKITLAFNSDARNKKIAEWAQAQWKKHLGIEVELENKEWKSYLSELKNDAPQIYRLGWGADYPDPDNFMNLFTSYSGNNHTAWNNEKFDQLIQLASQEGHLEKRAELYKESQKLLLEKETVIVPLFNAQQNRLIHPRLKNYFLLPVDFVYFKKVSIK